MFQWSLSYSIEITYRPTYLDRMQDPELYDMDIESKNNPEQKVEPKCQIVLAKCLSELLAIALYLLMVIILIVSLLQQLRDGKPLTGIVEFFIAVAIDQAKSIPVQFVVWWVVIKRCGKFETLNFTDWEDE